MTRKKLRRPRAASLLTGYRNNKPARLTVHDQAMLVLLTYGWRNSEIAHFLKCTRGTIKNRFWIIYHRIGVSNRTEAALWMLRERPRNQTSITCLRQEVDQWD